MTGTIKIEVSNPHVTFSLALERNITILCGNSATGKTTLVEMLRDFEENSSSSGVSIRCSKACRTLSGRDWEYRLKGIENSIVFIDEGNAFVKSQAFAEAIRGSSNYYVLITRESLYQLPYSVNSILKLKKTTSKSKKTYVKSYPQYDRLDAPLRELPGLKSIITEDSNSGNDLFSYIAQQMGIPCISAQGKSNVFPLTQKQSGNRILIVADGAAFGAEVEKLVRFMEVHPGQLRLYLPESFEWLILKSGILKNQAPIGILQDPSNYIDSTLYFSWEQYFTSLLIQLTQDTVMRYSKDHLNRVYLQEGNVEKLLKAMEEET